MLQPSSYWQSCHHVKLPTTTLASRQSTNSFFAADQCIIPILVYWYADAGKYLATTGIAYDGQVCIWNYQTGSLLCKQHMQAEVSSVCFTEDSNSVIVVGKQLVKVSTYNDTSRDIA